MKKKGIDAGNKGTVPSPLPVARRLAYSRSACDSPFISETVRDHYQRLAPVYNRKANAACTRAYIALVNRCLAGATRVLELGAGATTVTAQLDAPLKVACDLSWHMLAASPVTHRTLCDATLTPFPDASFDAIVSINLLEHVPEPRRIFEEAARLLTPGGRFLAVTPNGDHEWLLDLLERLRLKLPEGPHRFLATKELADLVPQSFSVLEHKPFLAFPAGPDVLVQAMDRLCNRGLFQFIFFNKGSR